MNRRDVVVSLCAGMAGIAMAAPARPAACAIDVFVTDPEGKLADEAYWAGGGFPGRVIRADNGEKVPMVTLESVKRLHRSWLSGKPVLITRHKEGPAGRAYLVGDRVAKETLRVRVVRA